MTFLFEFLFDLLSLIITKKLSDTEFLQEIAAGFITQLRGMIKSDQNELDDKLLPLLTALEKGLKLTPSREPMK